MNNESFIFNPNDAEQTERAEFFRFIHENDLRSEALKRTMTRVVEEHVEDAHPRRRGRRVLASAHDDERRRLDLLSQGRRLLRGRVDDLQPLEQRLPGPQVEGQPARLARGARP